MMKHEALVREALVKEGIALSNWKVEIKVNKSGYNFCELEITVYEPRCRKPATVWSAPYDMTRNLLHWCDAKLLYNKYC